MGLYAATGWVLWRTAAGMGRGNGLGHGTPCTPRAASTGRAWERQCSCKEALHGLSPLCPTVASTGGRSQVHVGQAQVFKQ